MSTCDDKITVIIYFSGEKLFWQDKRLVNFFSKSFFYFVFMGKSSFFGGREGYQKKIRICWRKLFTAYK